MAAKASLKISESIDDLEAKALIIFSTFFLLRLVTLALLILSMGHHRLEQVDN